MTTISLYMSSSAGNAAVTTGPMGPTSSSEGAQRGTVEVARGDWTTTSRFDLAVEQYVSLVC